MKTIKTMLTALALVCLGVPTILAQDTNAPVRIAVVGLTHVHAMTFIPQMLNRPDIQLVGIVESNHDIALRYQKQFKLDPSLFYSNLDALRARTNVQAVFCFAATSDHLRVVKDCAAHHLDVMVEKPMARTADEARAMEAAAENAGIKLAIDYETTWYPAAQEAYTRLRRHEIGDLRKVFIRDGHQGPVEIQCPPEFLEWATDTNGGGALMDFACYGANIMTWLMDGERPTSVIAVTQHWKPEVYPKVEDEATVLLIYPKARAVLEATWNDPFNRKEMELTGQTGYFLVPKGDVLRMRTASAEEAPVKVAPLPASQTGPLSYLVAMERGVEPEGRSSAKLNVTAMEILDAARESARTGKRIDLPR